MGGSPPPPAPTTPKYTVSGGKLYAIRPADPVAGLPAALVPVGVIYDPDLDPEDEENDGSPIEQVIQLLAQSQSLLSQYLANTEGPPPWTPMVATGGDEVFDIAVPGGGGSEQQWRVHIFRSGTVGSPQYFHRDVAGTYGWVEYLVVDSGSPGGYADDFYGGGGAGGAVHSSVQGDPGQSRGRAIAARMAITLSDTPAYVGVTYVPPATPFYGQLSTPSFFGNFPSSYVSTGSSAGGGGVGVDGGPYNGGTGSDNGSGGGGSGPGAGGQCHNATFGYDGGAGNGSGGGGGGAGGVGSAGAGANTPGGAGVISTITGVAVEYGRGGNGGVATPATPVADTGRGGDGAQSGQAGRGSTGVVIIRYPLEELIEG